VLGFRATRRHYEEVSKQLSLGGWTPGPVRMNRVLVPISGIQRAVLQAIEYAKTLSPDVRAVYVDTDANVTRQLEAQWNSREGRVPLVVLESAYRSLMEPLLEYIERVSSDHPDDYVTVVLPEFVPARWWHHLFHNQSALLIKGALLFKPNTVVTSVPFHLRR
jgi:nucleotide-binding universal stress UspA family protein